MVAKPGRAFVRHLINHSKKLRSPSRRVRLNLGARADIAWWCTFMPKWNGLSFFSFQMTDSAFKLHQTRQAHGGCGAFCRPEWFHFPWPINMHALHIVAKELIPIIITAEVWGHLWKEMHVNCNCDNEAVVLTVNKSSAKDSHLVHLPRCLQFYAYY